MNKTKLRIEPMSENERLLQQERLLEFSYNKLDSNRLAGSRQAVNRVLTTIKSIVSWSK